MRWLCSTPHHKFTPVQEEQKSWRDSFNPSRHDESQLIRYSLDVSKGGKDGQKTVNENGKFFRRVYRPDNSTIKRHDSFSSKTNIGSVERQWQQVEQMLQRERIAINIRKK